MARFSSRRADRPLADDRTQLHYFERFVTNRCEGLNTYSGRMTSDKAISSSRFTKHRLDPLQHRLVPDVVAGRVQMDAINGVMLRHCRQRNERRMGFLAEFGQDCVVAIDR